MIPNNYFNNMDFTEQDLNSVGDLDQLAGLLGRGQEQMPEQAGFGDLMARLTALGGQQSDYASMQPMEPDLGDPRTLSGRVQEFVGAKKPNEQGIVGQILSNRFTQEDDGLSSFGDIGQGMINSLTSGKLVTGQDVAGERALQQSQMARAMSGGSTPAAIQIANEIQRRRQMGDEAGAQLLESTSKIYDKGVNYDPYTNSVSVIPGYGSAVGDIARDKRTGARQADIATAAEIERQKMLGGPLPNTVVQSQDELIDAMQTHKYLSGQMDKFTKQIDSGQLNLNVIGNLYNKQLNNISLSTEESRNLASFQATLERLRNESLRLNKGVQTEGDSQRAWQELVANINDPGVVRQRLNEIKEYNNIAKDLKFERLKLMRGEFGRETPADMYGAQGQGSNPAINQPYDQIAPVDSGVTDWQEYFK